MNKSHEARKNKRRGFTPIIVLECKKINPESRYTQTDLANIFDLTRAQISAMAIKYDWPKTVDFGPIGGSKTLKLRVFYKGSDIIDKMKPHFPEYFS